MGTTSSTAASTRAGADADWQYEHYRFEITRQDSFLFHVTDGQRIVRTYRGKVEFLPQYKARIVIRMDGPAHHIIEEKPTLYRETFLFYYVFHSPHYHNVFFKKGHYKPIN